MAYFSHKTKCQEFVTLRLSIQFSKNMVIVFILIDRWGIDRGNTISPMHPVRPHLGGSIEKNVQYKPNKYKGHKITVIPLTSLKWKRKLNYLKLKNKF